MVRRRGSGVREGSGAEVTHKFQRGDLAWVAPSATLQGDMEVGALVEVIGRDVHDDKLPVAARWLLYNGEHNKYTETKYPYVPEHINGYWFHDRDLIPIELETEAASEAQTDVPLAEGELPKP